MPRPGRWVAVLLGCAALTIAACGPSRSDPPPSPTSAFEPEVASLVATVDDDATEGRVVVLENGTALNLNDERARLWNSFGEVIPGALMLAGSGRSPTWWIVLATKNRVHPSGAPSAAQVPDGLCWYLSGGAYDDGDTIHFSNGLRLPKPASFLVVPTWVEDPFPARASDYFCVDRQGKVTSLDFIWVGGY